DSFVYEKIKADYLALANRLGLENIDFIPVSALKGDNIVHRSEKTPWYEGVSLLDYLETVDIEDSKLHPWRFPVQWVVRPQTEDLHDYRGYAGRVIGDGLKAGEEVVVLPSGVRSTIKSVELAEQQFDQAQSGQSIILHLTDDIRSEERRVGKECRSRWSPDDEKKKK